MLTVLADAAMMIAAVSVLVNFILFSFLFTGYTRPVETRVLLRSSKKEFAQTDSGSGDDLEIALSVVSAKIQPLELVRPG